jgi:uncharacterized protein YhjY with autotransporter beta-barrel domain
MRHHLSIFSFHSPLPAVKPRRSAVSQAVDLLLLAASATLLPMSLAQAQTQYYQDISTANGANGVSPPNAGNGGNDDGKGGDAPNNVQSAGGWFWYDPASYTGVTGPAVQVMANGGRGGDGGNAAEGLPFFYQNGGAAANAGNAGVLDLAFYSQLAASNGHPTIYVTAIGGDGGNGGQSATYGASGRNGVGGGGGTITLAPVGSVSNTTPYTGGALAPAAVVMEVAGGNGGGNEDDSARTSSAHAYGAAGGLGGYGGPSTGTAAITFTTSSNNQVATSISSQGPGVVALSSGGDGGQGAQAIGAGAGATGGNGGNGGSGGDIVIDTVTTAISARGVDRHGTAATIPLDPDHPAVQGASSFVSGAVIAQSLGGDGGLGGEADDSFSAHAGSGGSAGMGGTVTVASTGALTSVGYGAAGIAAQSIGGSGGDGASAGAIFSVKAGGGGAAGNGNLVQVNANSPANAYAVISTAGDDADAIIAQSIGGGGGNGGSVSISAVAGAAVALGGRGETGGNGSQVTVNIGAVDPDTGNVTPGAILSTNGLRSAGVVAQSIGGGGGNGGSAYATALGSPAALSIGGSGGSGGDAGAPDDGYQWVQVNNLGFIQTAGEHAAGVLAQAIGGGGGAGGAAHSLDVGAQVTMAAAVGGSGGTGGTAGGVTVSNGGTIVTMNGDAFGVLAQSIGGGGGQGGASWAETINVFNSPEVPSVNITTSIGGNGGSGGNAGAVTVHNSGIVFTQQAGSIGVYAQSVGGGGGTGGMSGAAEIATQSSNVNASVTVGGKGRAGGTGGNVQVTNDEGVVMTFGENAIGIWAQSIGGGGGYGGAAKSDTASFLSENKGLTVGVSVGGGAGSGNIGGAVSVANNGGSVLTLGDGARGVAAQSVGGGGGYGGGSSAGSSGGTVTANVSVAGNGGSGGDGGTVGVTNSGSVVTFGGKADGIFAHSIGGGGGVGGNAATGGGTDPELRLTDYIQQGLGINAQYTTLADNIYGFGKDELLGDKAIAAMRSAGQNYLDANKPSVPAPDSENTSWTWSIDIGAAIGGKGGSGGNGNTVTVGNSGTVATIGANSAGIYAQSVGGGGGVGGTVTAVNNNQGLAQKNIPVSMTIGVGGAGGSGGHGGNVTVTNTGAISTEGAASHGVYAQSVGAGGGDGGGTVSSWTQVHFTEISLGGDGGATGDGGVVSVTANDPTSTITTSGPASMGVLAQSIGGGGGTLTLMESAPAAQGGTMSSNINWLPQHVNATLVPLRFAGASGSADCGSTGTRAANCGNGDQIDIQAGNISTSGSNSHAVVAQSAGGGGGMLIGTIMQNGDLFGAATSTTAVGNANQVTVTVGPGTVQTTGAGAYGVLAQSNGGGSLVGGDFSTTGVASTATAVQTHNSHLNGNGGPLAITVDEGSAIKTTGALAHGIVAQSNGGGGALVATDGALVMGTGGGAGTSGQIDVTVNGSVSTTGAGASAVVINAEGATPSANAVNLTVGANGSVVSSNATTAVVIRSSAASNTITNNGTIGAPGADAILSTGTGVVNVVNSGWITGGVEIGQGTFQIVGTTGGWTPGAYNSASTFTNNVEIDLGTRHTFAGNLVNNDLLYTSANFVDGTGGVAVVTGTATMNPGARLMVEPSALAAKPFTMLTAGTLQLNATPTVVARNGGQFTYNLSTANNQLTITPQANVGNTVQALAGSEGMLNLARHLDAGFTSTVSGEMAQHYAALARVPDGAGLLATLASLGNESAQSVGTAHLARSQRFVEHMGSCPQFDTSGARLQEQPCGWARITGNNARLGSALPGAGYTNEDYTVQIGGQTRVADGWFVGGALSADDSRARAATGMTSVDGRGATVGAMLKYESGNWLFTGAVDAGIGSYESKREVLLGSTERKARASFNGRHVGVHGQVAYQHAFGDWSVKPYIDVHATHLRTDGYTENGAGALDLRVADASDTLYAVSPMLELGRRVDFTNGMKLHAYAGAGMTVVDDNRWEADAQLLGIAADAGSFKSVATAPNRRTRLNLGAKLFTVGKLDFRLEYARESAGDFRSHSAWLKLNYLY